MKKVLIPILIFLNCFYTVTGQEGSILLKPEKIYLHTDRDAYVTGEDLFYSLYLQGNPDQYSKFAYLIIRDQNDSFISKLRLEINNQAAFGTIALPDTLSSGIYQIVCYTNCMRNQSEESYFKKEIIIANRFDKKLNLFRDSINIFASKASSGQNSGSAISHENLAIHLDRTVFKQREKISFSIEAGNIPGNSVSYLSVSVSEIVPDIPLVSAISDYFTDTTRWRYNDTTKESRCYFTPEVKGAVIQGKVKSQLKPDIQTDSVNSNGADRQPTYTLLVSVVDSIVNMQYTATDSLGSFRIHLDPYYEGKELYIRVKENVKATIETDNKFFLSQPFNPSDRFKSPGIRSSLLRSENIVQIQKFYNEQSALALSNEFIPGKIVPRIYFNRFSTIYPSDFLELNDFVEITKEIIPGLKLRKNGDKYVSGYINFQDQTYADSQPSIFLDGVPIDDINQIISLGTGQIRRIESLPVTRYYGDMLFPGILAIFSKDLFINTVQFKTPAIKYQSLSSQPYAKPKPFNASEESRHNPDMRQLLLWEPDLILKQYEKKEIECYASDLQGKYRIDIQGITSKGDPVNGSAIIFVQSKSK
jgi:hypothetical protein